MFQLDPPTYNGTVHDEFLKLDSDSRCCLITEQTSEGIYKACCAWDIHIGMDGGRDLVGSTDDVVAVFITMDLGYPFLPKVGSEVN